MSKTAYQIKKSVGATNGLKTKDKTRKTSAQIKEDVKAGKYDLNLLKSELESTINISSLSSDISSMGKTIEGAYNGWKSSDTMNNTKESIEALQSRLRAYKDYQRLFGEKGATRDIDTIQSSFVDALRDIDKLSTHYGAYKNADEYNKALKAAEEYEKLKNTNIGDVQKEIDNLEGLYTTASTYQEELDSLLQGLINIRGNVNVTAITNKVNEATKKRDDYLKSIGYDSIESLEKVLGEKTQFKNKASRIQNGIKMASVADPKSENYDPEFADKSKYIAPEYGFFEWNPSDKDHYKFVNKDYEGFDDDTLGHLGGTGAAHMTTEEIAIYNYYYNTYGSDKAMEYFNTIKEGLGNRLATKIHEQINGNTLGEYFYGAVAGLDQFASGMRNVFNTKDEYIPVSTYQQLSGMIRADYEENDEFFTKLGYDLINTTSNMLPSILASSALGTINPALGTYVGAGLMGASASGNAYQEMLNLGYDKGQARTYSTLVGVAEGGLQTVLGGIGKLGGTSAKISKAVAGIDNGLARFAIRFGGSMASEGLEEGLQEVLDPIFRNFATNGLADADVDWGEVVYSALLGGLSGGVLEGGSIATSTYAEGKANTTMGSTLKANERVGDVFDIASNPDIASVYDLYTKYAKKGINAENVSDYQLGRMYNEAVSESKELLDAGSTKGKASTVHQRNSAQNILDDFDVYTQSGVKSRTGASHLVKEDVFKDYDTEAIVNLIESGLESAESTDSHRIATELKAKIENYDTLAEIVEKKWNLEEGETLTEEESKILAENIKSISAKELAQLSEATDQTLSAEESENVKAQIKDMGADEDLANIVARKMRGETLTDLETQALEESGIDTSVIAKRTKITESVKEGGISPDVAEVITKKAEGKKLTMEEAEKLTSNNKALNVLADTYGEEFVDIVKGIGNKTESNLFLSLYDGKMDIETYANAFNLVSSYAKNDFTHDYILKNRHGLSVEQVAAIYRNTRLKVDNKREARIDKIIRKTADKKAYKGVIDESVIDYNNTSAKGKVNWNDLDARQKKAVTFVKGIAQASGMNLILVANNKKFNGAFNVDGNTIYLDIFAGINHLDKLADTIIPTMSHELTHWMKNKAPALWRQMNEIVFSTLQKADGLTESGRIAKEITNALAKEYREKYRKENPGKDISLKKAYKLIPKDVLNKALNDKHRQDVARQEIVARACEDMLSRSKVGQELFNSLNETEQKTLIEKIKDVIKDFLNWVKEFLSEYESTSYEATIMRMYEDKLNELSKLWDKALARSVEVNQALEKSGRFGVRDFSALAKAVDTDGNSLFQYKAMVEDEKTYRAMLIKHQDTIGITDAQITELFNTIDKAVEIISKNYEALDYAWDADINERAFSPIKPNSDSLYKVSLDFSTLCRKRLLQQTIQQTLQNALNKNLSTAESIAIRDELMKIQEEGRKIEIACALCYVESARMKSPKQINKFLNNRESVIKEFFASRSGGSIKEKIANAETKARQTLQKKYPDGLIGKNDVKLDALTAKLSHMKTADAEFIRDAKKKAKESYKLTEHEQAELDSAMKMSVNDFTSAKGLENLAKNHPDLFDAYTSFVRNATHSKGIENDTWWRAGDSESIGDNLIAQMNAENGLRSQSWSDFQVIHLLDYIAATIELSTKGAKRQSYTKVPDYVKLLGNTGDMINMSLIPERAFNGKLAYDPVEGMAYEIAKQLRDEYHETVGTICIGIENEQIKMLLEDATIDMVIPYHHSSMSQAARKLMHIPSWITYEKSQNEKKASSEEDAKANAKKYGVSLKKDNNYQKSPKFSEWFNLEEARQIAKMENDNPTDMDAYKKYGKMYGGYKAMQNAANNYLKLCAERGLTPKFSTNDADFTQEANYWKLLTDRKMVDNITGEIIEQKTIKPIFKEKSILEILNDELARYPQVKADQEYAQRKVVEKFLSGDMTVDKSTLDAIKKPIDNVTEVNILESSRDNEVLSKKRTRLSENDLDEYLRAGTRTNKVKQKALDNGKKIILTTNEEITDFIHESIKDASSLNTVGYGRVDERLSHDVDEYSDGDIKISGSFLELVPYDISHSYKEHLNAKEEGDIDLSLADFENIPSYLEHYDELVYARRFNSGNTKICVSKKLPNGRVLIVEVVSKSRGSIAFKNMLGVTEEKYARLYESMHEKRNSSNTRGSKSSNNSLRDESVSDNSISPSEENVNTLFSERDSEYLELAKNPEQNETRLRKMVDEAAKGAGYDSPHLYHGTAHFGYTIYEDKNHKYPFIYTSTKSSVASHYAGDNHYASVRQIGKKYDGGSSVDSIIKDAETVWGTKFREVKKSDRTKLITNIYGEATLIADEIDNLRRGINIENEAVSNAVDWMSVLFYDFRDADDKYYLAKDERTKDMLRKEFIHGVEKFNTEKEILREYYENNRSSLSTQEKRLFAYLTGYDVGDFVIDVQYKFLKAISEESVLVNDVGTWRYPSELRESLDLAHNIGAYRWYGNLGDNPYIFDAKGGQFYALRNPDMGDGWYDTDSISKWALDHGYTSVIMKNIYDYGDMADNYVFFNSNQVKSADLVTYDDDGNIIPLSERFNEQNEDIRYSERDTTSVYDTMGETDRILKENEKFKAEIERLKERLKIERKVTKGNYFNTSQLGAVAGHLRNISKSNMDKVELMKSLKELYSYFSQTEDLNWQDVFERCYRIADSMLKEAKPLTLVDDYSKSLLKEIRETRISLSESQKKVAQEQFGKNWNRNFMGKVTLANDGKSLDSVWQEWSKKNPNVFDAKTNSEDMVGELYNIIETLKETSVTLDEYGMAEQKRWLANEIYNQYWNLSPIRTTADKYESRIKELNSAHRNAMKELRDSYESRLVDKGIADDIHYGKKLSEAKEKYGKKFTEQKQRQKEMHKKLYAELRERKDSEIALAKEHGREMMSKYKENAERKTRIQSIASTSLSLNEMLVKNSKDKHIPEIMKGPVTSLLQAIDFSSNRLLKTGEPTKKDVSLSKALSKVKDMMVKATNAHEELVELYGHGLDEDIEKMVDNVDTIMRLVGDNEFVLNQMSLEDLQTLDKMVKTIKHAVNKLNKFHMVNHAKGVADLAQSSMEYMYGLGEANLHDKLRGKADTFLNWSNALPYYVFKRYGPGGMKVFEALMDGWDALAFNTKQVIDFTEEAYKDNEVKEWSEKVETLKIKGKTVKMTVAQIMALYSLNKREQGRKHLYQGGFRVANFTESKDKIVAQTDGVRVSEMDVANIISKLTDRQREVADKLQEFMNTVCAEWGNAVSMARFGYKAFGEENYFPIKSEPNGVRKEDPKETENSIYRLLNMSFAKETDANANNRVVISDIFDVFAQHTSDMAKYNALALPVLDSLKWYNYSEKIEYEDGTHDPRGVKGAIERAFGTDGQSYFNTLLEDINGKKETERGKIAQDMLRKYKIATVGANFRVILLQPTSYLRAEHVMEGKYLAKASAYIKLEPISMVKKLKKAIANAEKYCGIALWKSMGYYDTNIQRGLETQIKHSETFKDKVIEKSMKGAEIADKVTWGALWTACEFEIRDKRKDLKVGSEEFYQAIGKRLREVIYATQVVDSTLTRSHLMRGGGFAQAMTNFASEPTLSYNILLDAHTEYSMDAKKYGRWKSLKKHSRKLSRMARIYVMSSAVTALIESLFDAFRAGDDDDEDFLSMYWGNLINNLSITAKIPFVKELHSIGKGFDVSVPYLEWAVALFNAFDKAKKLVDGKGNDETVESLVRNLLKSISYASGLPIYSGVRDIWELFD